MENWRDFLGLLPILVIVLVAVVFVRAGRKTKPHGDNPRESTGGGGSGTHL